MFKNKKLHNKIKIEKYFLIEKIIYMLSFEFHFKTHCKKRLVVISLYPTLEYILFSLKANCQLMIS